MTIIEAIYFAYYDDHDGYDEVPCYVDTDKMEVVKFLPATECRWFEDAVLMCEEEGILLADGREFDAIKFDEYNDAVYCGYDDEYDRENIVLFDADALSDAMEGFRSAAQAEAMEGYCFHTCEPADVPGLPTNTETVSRDVHDAFEHMKRAIATMEKNNERVAGYNEKWPGFYDSYLIDATEMLERLKAVAASFDGLEAEVRRMG